MRDPGIGCAAVVSEGIFQQLPTRATFSQRVTGSATGRLILNRVAIHLGRRQWCATVGVTGAVLPKSLGWSRRLSGLGRLRPFQLSKGFLHALPEVTAVVVLKSAIVRLDLHLTLCTLRDQGDVVGALQDRSGNGDMSGVLHLIGSSHQSVVTLLDVVVLRIAKDVFDRAPQLAARSGIGILGGLAERRQSKSKRYQSHNHVSRLHHGIAPRTDVLRRMSKLNRKPRFQDK